MHKAGTATAGMGGRRIIVRMTAAAPPGGLADVFDRLHRLAALLGSCRPDDLNMLVVRLVTAIEQVCRYVLAAHLRDHPEEDKTSAVVWRDTFEHIRYMDWADIVAADLNVSSVDDIRSVLDRCGMGWILTKKMAAALGRIMPERNAVVHAMADACIDGRSAYLVVEELIRGILAQRPEMLVKMDASEARSAERVKGVLRSPRECYESIVKRCDDIDPDEMTAVTAAHNGDALLWLGRHVEALEAYGRAVEIDPGDAQGHAGRGEALSRLGRHVEALEAYGRAAEIDPGSALVHAGRGDALSRLGRYGEARSAYGAASGAISGAGGC